MLLVQQKDKRLIPCAFDKLAKKQDVSYHRLGR